MTQDFPDCPPACIAHTGVAPGAAPSTLGADLLQPLPPPPQPVLAAAPMPVTPLAAPAAAPATLAASQPPVLEGSAPSVGQAPVAGPAQLAFGQMAAPQPVIASPVEGALESLPPLMQFSSAGK